MIPTSEINSSSLKDLAAKAGVAGVELVEHRGEFSLWKDEDGIRYINDGADSYSELGDEFQELFDEVFAK